MGGNGCITRRHFRRGEIESDAIGPGFKMDKSFEVGFCYGPSSRREATLVMVDYDSAVKRSVG